MDMAEIIFVDKPKGVTSFDVIRLLRKKLGIQKMGHAGTLDPLATGLMIIGIGSGTKKLTEYIGLPKVYEAEILVGERRTTGDVDGEVLEERVVENISEKDVGSVLASLKGVQRLPVPIYSALKRGGEALYKKARRGERITPSQMDMEIKDILLQNIEKDGEKVILRVRCEVGSGTYVRSLAETVGKRLGYPATLKNLRRIAIGSYTIDDAEKLEGI